MRWIRDSTGRFPERPYYEPQELDELCEDILERFLTAKYGKVEYPVPTDALEVLLEKQAVTLDCYADLTVYGDDTEGATVFSVDGTTDVRISRTLSEDPARENRYRTTLSHELGHVLLHGPLYRAGQTGDLFEISSRPSATSATCKRHSVHPLLQADWLEWQAGYVSGAVLMPISRLKECAAHVLDGTGSVPIASSRGALLVQHVRKQFQVSTDAAEVRLQQVGLLVAREVSRLL